MRKIKAFNVDEDIYNGLLSFFKKHKVNASLSSFVSNCLTELLDHLKEMEAAREDCKSFDMPMSFVISEMIKSLNNKKSILPFAFAKGSEMSPEEIKALYAGEILGEWEDEYKAHQLGISLKMYSYVKTGKYVLSPDKQFLIETKTGKRCVIVPIGEGVLMDMETMKINE